MQYHAVVAGVRAAAVSAAVLLLTVAVAGPSAATQLAGLKLSPANGQPGTTVKVTGTWFAAANGAVTEASPVQLWWGAEGERLLAVAQPDRGGTFITSVTVPGDAVTGPHLISATQTVTDADGITSRAPGAPGRAQFVVGAVLDTPTPSVPAARATSSGDRAAATLLAITVAGLGMAGVGGSLLAREMDDKQDQGR